MAGAITDLLDRVTDSTTGRPVISSLASPGKALAAASINLSDVTNWSTSSAIHFSIFDVITVAGITVKDPTTQTDWKGTLAGSTISNLTLTGGTDRAYTAGAIAELTPTARYAKDLYDWGIAHANQDGSLKTSAVQAALNIGTVNPDWTPLATPPSTVVYNGQRSYDVTIPGVDYTDRISPGARIRITRAVESPTQSSSLNGTNQYWIKTSPNKITFTDDFVVSAWVKISSYQSSAAIIASRYSSTGGWWLGIVANTGQIRLEAANGSVGNNSRVTSIQSIPLNRWVHITAQLDMSAFSTTSTTSYIMIDGVEVPSEVTRSGTNPTSLSQNGNLEIGAGNGGNFPLQGKIAQVAIFNSKVTQATMRSYMSQGLTGTETSLVSAYSFSNVVTDLNTTTPNDLTASGAATATEADSPFGAQANGTISSTVDYGIVQSVSFSTDTRLVVQVPEGCTIPTAVSISSISYSTAKTPFGFPAEKQRWKILQAYIATNTTNSGSATPNVWTSLPGVVINLPVGNWDVGVFATINAAMTSSATYTLLTVGLSTSPTSMTNRELTSQLSGGSPSAFSAWRDSAHVTANVTHSAVTPYYFIVRCNRDTTANGISMINEHDSPGTVYALNGYL